MNLKAEKIELKDSNEAIEFYYAKGWTDGFPIVPPTVKRVQGMLASVNVQADSIIGAIPERGRVFTAEVVAINAVMAGCLPGYFPIVVAAVRAITDPAFGLHGPTASTAGAGIMIAVNGPIANEIGMNSGENALGPGNRANATIGRAIRLLMINAGGSREFDRATLGNPGKYSFCFAEKETNWTPFHVQRGLQENINAVTVFACDGPNQVNNHTSLKGENILKTMADRMSGLGTFNMGSKTEMAVILCPEHYRHLDNEGWTKEQIQQFFYDHAVRPLTDLKKRGYIEAPIMPGDEKKLVHAVPSPEHLLLFVAGGEAGRFSAFMPGWAGSKISKSITKPIEISSGFT